MMNGTRRVFGFCHVCVYDVLTCEPHPCLLCCSAGNVSAAAAFAVAFLGDVLDVAAHVVVVTGLLHTHFQVS
jgi:hypothetical protein